MNLNDSVKNNFRLILLKNGDGFMNRKIVNVSLVLLIILILYNTLIPFQFESASQSFGDVLKSFEWKLFVHNGERSSLTDIAGNILLFFPLGCLFVLWFHQRRLRGGLIFATVFGFLLSALIEFLQLYISGRNSSATDLFNNTLGAFLGGVGALIYFRTIARPVSRFLLSIIREQPLTLILVVVFAFQGAGSLLPFNVSITFSDVVDSLKVTNIFPFQYKSLSMFLFDRPTRWDVEPFNWFLFWENALFWMVWGYLVALCYHLYWKGKKFEKVLLLSVAFLPSVLFEFLQLFIVSRFSDINDVIAPWIGTVVGLAIYSRYRPHLVYTEESRWKCLKGALVLYTFFILYSGLQPFDFIFSSGAAMQELDYRSFIPFYTYYKKTSIWDIYDVANSLFFIVPFSLYFTYGWLKKGVSWSKMYLRNWAIGFAVGSMIEVIQVFSAERVAEITDALLYGMGGLLGTFLVYYYLKEIEPTLHSIRDPQLSA